MRRFAASLFISACFHPAAVLGEEAIKNTDAAGAEEAPMTGAAGAAEAPETGAAGAAETPETGTAGSEVVEIKTTAYTHTESDHVKYGDRSAAGTRLRYGAVRSAAADWSKYPVGTQFRIVGQSHVYEIDDYGSALVGKDVIDLYKPTASAMDKWGARNVKIEVLKWGCWTKSLTILRPRVQHGKYLAQMVRSIENRLEG